MNNITSLGPVTTYFDLINLVEKNKHLWRKSANLLNTARRNMRPWVVVDRNNQIKATMEYVEQALKDTKFPDNVKEAIKFGMAVEFKFQFTA